MNGAAIWIDPSDNGNLNISAENGSIINGSIVANGTGNKNIEIDDSILTNGKILIGGHSVNNVTLKNGSVEPRYNALNGAVIGSHTDAIVLTNSLENHVTLDHESLNGIKRLSSTKNSDLFIKNNSHDVGDIVINPGGKASLDINNSKHDGNISIAGKQGSTVLISDGAQSSGNITFGAGDNQLIVKNNAAMSGNARSGTG